MIALDYGKAYVDGDGTVANIEGPTKANAAWCWSRQGFWYVKATGERLTYGRLAPGGEWGHYVDARRSLWLVREAAAS